MGGETSSCVGVWMAVLVSATSIVGFDSMLLNSVVLLLELVVVVLVVLLLLLSSLLSSVVPMSL